MLRAARGLTPAKLRMDPIFELSEYRDMLCSDEVVWVMVGFVGVGWTSYRGRARGTGRCEGGSVIVCGWRKD
jgi:hypothetical protein